jgi:hypothetical protein
MRMGRTSRASLCLQACVLGPVAALHLSCAGLRLPSAAPEFDPASWPASERNGLTVRALPIEGREQYWDLFDENLPSLGIAAVWIEVRNNGPTSVDLGLSRWKLNVHGQGLSALAASQFLDAYYRGRRVRMYSSAADVRARADLARVMLSAGGLRPGGREEGFLFFRIGPDSESDWSRAATLTASAVRLDSRTAILIELPLAHAAP